MDGLCDRTTDLRNDHRMLRFGLVRAGSQQSWLVLAAGAVFHPTGLTLDD